MKTFKEFLESYNGKFHNTDPYLDIGHDDGIPWYYDKQKEKIFTRKYQHETGDSFRNWSGRFDKNKNKISIVPPHKTVDNDDNIVPQKLIVLLKRKFGRTAKLVPLDGAMIV